MAMSLGCEHYQRKVSFLTPCCRKEYACRRCHDAKEDHTLNCHSVQTIVCLLCRFSQGITNCCFKCGSDLAQYFCERCRMYDDVDKGQFHCDKCDICRVGGAKNYFHCDTCNLCLHVNIRYKHQCIQNIGRDGCTVCLEDIRTSVATVMVPECGHLIHQICYNSLLNNNIKDCPTCRTTLRLFELSFE